MIKKIEENKEEWLKNPISFAQKYNIDIYDDDDLEDQIYDIIWAFIEDDDTYKKYQKISVYAKSIVGQLLANIKKERDKK